MEKVLRMLAMVINGLEDDCLLTDADRRKLAAGVRSVASCLLVLKNNGPELTITRKED
jgi:hypothetical protein